jgi:methyl-accepting chemotaxis protein
LEGIAEIEKSLAEIARATEDQAKGAGQVSQGLQEIEKLTQQNTLNASAGADAAAAMTRKTVELEEALEPFSASSNGSAPLPFDVHHSGRNTALVAT